MFSQLMQYVDLLLVHAGVLQWLREKIADVTSTIKLLVTLLCIGGLLYLMVKAKFQVKAVIVGLCVAGLVFWAVALDGYQSLAALLAPEFDK